MSKENKNIFIIVIITDYIVKLWCNLIVTEFFKFWGGHMSSFMGHWYPHFGLLVNSPLGSKAALFALGKG